MYNTIPASSYQLRRDALTDVRTRRILAIVFDLVVVGVLAAVLWVVLLIMTFGLSWFFLPPLFPLVAFLYNGLTVSGVGMGTWGMRAMDVEARMHESGSRVPFINAAAHVLFFYLSWFFPPVFLVSLLDGEKRFLHDILAGVVLTRRL
jgi:uncharacterized RDD family membrane protein YckC